MNKYNNGIIYKLVCKDSSITDIYIGSTTNFTKRKCAHKGSCNNSNDINHNLYKYEFIRAHGGWDNWDMIEIIKINCNDRYELEKEERAQFDIYKPTLNKNRPQITNIEWIKQKKESCKVHYEANKDKIIVQVKAHYEANKDKYKAREKAYYEANKDKRKAQDKAYYEANKDKAKAQKKAHYEANKDKIKAHQKAYYEANKDKVKDYHKAYYEKKKAEKLAALETSN